MANSHFYLLLAVYLCYNNITKLVISQRNLITVFIEYFKCYLFFSFLVFKILKHFKILSTKS
ncbi:hypothetical protein COT96_01680 [Candidatus Falkowbacteria bacterium CG10_big_fil_rev_8_21_14_0_10_38_22]|uniref:Uncharacterized protein n=1 Tax=Candidatus Falkowbacteria bacterium CG10_big_fil_rev_8_21_14_0_10_38_22 TaxID=1974564 RepID=A0A2M6WR09_9BACT|nr:MAG: hypothetical protein COT96_01680 [Candidatus Falkowbacteria bacterium CG10_big_fil_rev_8_21_14_0_10_38_22]